MSPQQTNASQTLSLSNSLSLAHTHTHTDFWLSSPSGALAQEEELDAKRRQVKRHTHGPFYSGAFNKGQLTL